MTKHIVAVIDRSGSMSTIMDDMNGGIALWLGDITAADPDALLTSVLFDSEYEVTNDRTPLRDVKRTSLVIQPRGSTALNDAIMKGLATIKKKEDALVLIVTDGGENASKEVTTSQVRKRIAALEKQGVTFQYLSASPTAFADADAYGIHRAQTIAFAATTEGSGVVMSNLRSSSSTYLTNDTTAETA